MATPSTAAVLDSFEAKLNELYPKRRVWRRKNEPGSRAKLMGLDPSDVSADGCFVLTAGDPDPCEKYVSSEHVHFLTLVGIHYVKLAAPDERDEDPEVRATRLAVHDVFDVPRLPGLAGALLVGFDQGAPYTEPARDAQAVVSTQTVSVLTSQPRGVGS